MKELKHLRFAPAIALVFLLAACGGGGGGNQTVAGTNFTATTLEGLLTGAFSAGVDINDDGFAVGMADNGIAVQAVVWDTTTPTTPPTVLAPLAGNSYSAAYAINANGLAVGESGSGAITVAVFWPAASTAASALSTTGLFASGASTAYAINALGEIAGEAVDDAEGNTVAVYWLDSAAAPARLTNLGTIPNAFSAAYAISDSGVIVGESLKNNGDVVAVAWLPDGSGGYGAPVELPALINHVGGIALGVNEVGVVVGESEALDGTVHGVVWTIDATGTVAGPEDLGAATSAADVNAIGRIAGYTAAAAGNDSASMWSAAVLDDQQNIAPAFSQSYALNSTSQAVGVSGNQAVFIKP